MKAQEAISFTTPNLNEYSPHTQVLKLLFFVSLVNEVERIRRGENGAEGGKEEVCG